MDKEPLDFGLNDDTWNATTEDIPVEQAEQEPVAWRAKDANSKYMYGDLPAPELPFDQPKLLYAAPVRTKDLTADEIEEFYTRIWSGGKKSMFAFARAVIAADREKNK